MNTEQGLTGIRVLSTSPSLTETRVSVHRDIQIEFSMDVNPITIKGRVVVLRDFNRVYKNLESLKDYAQYAPVKGDVSYKEKVVTFTPEEPLEPDMGYIIMVNTGIASITGEQLKGLFVSTFFTEKTASYGRVEILKPKYGCISEYFPVFTWKNNLSPSYMFQISKANTFEVLSFEGYAIGGTDSEIIEYKPDFVPMEGIYYVRVRAEGSEWGNVHQIFIKATTDAVIANEDAVPDLSEFLENLEEPVEILEVFPADGTYNISLKINVAYVKIKGRYQNEDFYFPMCGLVGSSFNEDLESDAQEHGEVEGTWTVVYDEYFDVTYLIFTPVPLDAENPEFVETARSQRKVESL